MPAYCVIDQGTCANYGVVFARESLGLAKPALIRVDRPLVH